MTDSMEVVFEEKRSIQLETITKRRWESQQSKTRRELTVQQEQKQPSPHLRLGTDFCLETSNQRSELVNYQHALLAFPRPTVVLLVDRELRGVASAKYEADL